MNRKQRVRVRNKTTIAKLSRKFFSVSPGPAGPDSLWPAGSSVSVDHTILSLPTHIIGCLFQIAVLGIFTADFLGL